MPDIKRPGFNIHYEVTGHGQGVPLVLVSGLGEQIGSVEYPDEQCALFVERGFRVVRIDNRDVGLSAPSDFTEGVDIAGAASAFEKGVAMEAGPYSRQDMADDVIAVLDDLGIEQTNLVGASMGGYIVREIAVGYPDRVSSLTVVMSGSGALPGDDGPQLAAGLIAGFGPMSRPRERQDAIDYIVKQWRWMWGDSYEWEADWVRERVTAAHDRADRPEGIGRQLFGGVLTPGLWEAQTTISCPTLVIHGGQDPVFAEDHARAVAERIPGAELWLDPKMGHVMHREQWTEMADRVSALAERR
jgi:pimeloyl-ACP methyl ester carboxylesterase